MLLIFSLQTLYTYPENFRAYKALIAAQYSGGNVKVDPGFVFGETNKTDAFLKKFPLGKVIGKQILKLYTYFVYCVLVSSAWPRAACVWHMDLAFHFRILQPFLSLRG